MQAIPSYYYCRRTTAIYQRAGYPAPLTAAILRLTDTPPHRLPFPLCLERPSWRITGAPRFSSLQQGNNNIQVRAGSSDAHKMASSEESALVFWSWRLKLGRVVRHGTEKTVVKGPNRNFFFHFRRQVFPFFSEFSATFGNFDPKYLMRFFVSHLGPLRGVFVL